MHRQPWCYPSTIKLRRPPFSLWLVFLAYSWPELQKSIWHAFQEPHVFDEIVVIRGLGHIVISCKNEDGAWFGEIMLKEARKMRFRQPFDRDEKLKKVENGIFQTGIFHSMRERTDGRSIEWQSRLSDKQTISKGSLPAFLRWSILHAAIGSCGNWTWTNANIDLTI